MSNEYSFSQSFETKLPPDDDVERSMCTHCGFIDYKNPKIVVGAVATWEDRILLCKRAIEPRTGYWTVPAGYLEVNDTPEAGALREAYEEALATLEIDRLLAVYAVPHLSQVQLMFRARLTSPEIAPGPESQDVMLVKWGDIPWSQIAFPTVHWALNHFAETKNIDDFAPFSNPPSKI